RNHEPVVGVVHGCIVMPFDVGSLDIGKIEGSPGEVMTVSGIRVRSIDEVVRDLQWVAGIAVRRRETEHVFGYRVSVVVDNAIPEDLSSWDLDLVGMHCPDQAIWLALAADVQKVVVGDAEWVRENVLTIHEYTVAVNEAVVLENKGGRLVEV